MAYPAPQITPAPGHDPYGPQTTPMPQQASISGTQIASPTDWRASGAPMQPQAMPPKKSSAAPLIVGGILGVCAIGGVVIYLATRPSTSHPATADAGVE